MRTSGSHWRVALAATLLLGGPASGLVGAQDLVESNPGKPEEVLSETQGLFAEPVGVTRAVLTLDRVLGGSGGKSEGFYTVFGDLPSGAGWISGGRGYRHWYADEKVFFDSSASISWRGYKSAQAQIALPKLFHQHLMTGAQLRWLDSTQVNFYGEGAGSQRSDRSQFRMRSTSLSAYAAIRPMRWMAVEGRVGLLKPSLLEPGGIFKQNFPPTSSVFASNIVYSLSEQPAFVHQEVSAIADTRDYPGHPTRGGVLRGTIARYSDQDSGLFTFTRYEAEAARFVSLPRWPIVLALHGWLVSSDPAEGATVPFYLQPAMGGQSTLRSFADYRFHDRHSLVVNAEARVPLFTHVDGALFVDAGSVASRFADLGLAQRSYGVGVRLHSRRQTFGRADLAHGAEGWRILFRLNDPLQLTRLSRRIAMAPFVP
jgi:hypothetical protein